MARKFISFEEQGSSSAGAPGELAAIDSEIAEMTAVAETQAEVAQAESEIEQATNVTNALEEIAEVLGDAAENGGIDQPSSQVVEVAVEHLLASISFPAGRTLPSMESFGTSSGRARATTLAMESIGDTARKIWNAIIDALKKAIEKVEEFFFRIFNAAGKLRERAKALAEKARNTTGKAKENKFDDKALAKKLHIGANVTVAAVTAGSETLSKLVKSVSDTYVKVVSSTSVSTLTDFVADPKDAEVIGVCTSYLQFVTELSTVTTNQIDEAKATAKKLPKPGAGFTMKQSDELLGGTSIVSSEAAAPTTPDFEAARKTLKSWVRVQPFDGSLKDDRVKESLPTLDTGAAESICDKVAEFADELETFKRAMMKSKEQKKKLLEAAKKASAGMEKIKGDEGKAGNGTLGEKNLFTLAKEACTGLASQVDEPGKSFAAYVVNTGSALLAYVEKSLAQYSAD